MRGMIILLATLAAPLALAQTSASFTLEEHVFSAGGHPSQGTVMASAGFRISLDSIGEGVARSGLSSASYSLDASFAGCYPAPGEVQGLRFTDQQTLVWSPEKSVGVYNLYRDLLSGLPGLGYGACEQQGLAAATTTDADEPPPANGFFYLVTAENRIGEEGSKGWDSADGERSNTSACP